jgi:hypothetical protein
MFFIVTIEVNDDIIASARLEQELGHLFSFSETLITSNHCKIETSTGITTRIYHSRFNFTEPNGQELTIAPVQEMKVIIMRFHICFWPILSIDLSMVQMQGECICI